MRPGSDVEVRSRFDGGWVAGFEVDEVESEGEEQQVRVRRRSDGAVLPVGFSTADVREREPVTGR